MVDIAAIPVVDLAALDAGATADRHRLAAELLDVCGKPGSFYVVNYGIGEEVIAAAFEVSRLFLADYLVHPDFDTTTSCLPSCARPDWPAKYPPVGAGIDLPERLRGAYAG